MLGDETVKAKKISEITVKKHLLPVIKLIDPEINCSQDIEKICKEVAEKLILARNCINSVAQNDLRLNVGPKANQHLSGAIDSMVVQLAMG